MKHMTNAAVLLACLFLCGCGDNEESTHADETTTSAATVTTTVNTTTTEEQSSAKKTESTKSTTAAKNVSKSEKRESSAPDNDADIVVGGTAVSGTVTAKSDTQPQQTSAATATENDNILTDDGLNWSPLVPVE